MQYYTDTDSEKRKKTHSPLQQWGGWQEGSQCGTAIGLPHQSQVSQYTGGFATKSQFAPFTGTQFLPLQPPYPGPIEQLQQRLGSLTFSGIPPTQHLQLFTESQQLQPFTGVQQLQQQIESFSEAKQQFEPFTGSQQPQQQQPQLFSMSQYPQQQQFFAGIQPAQQLLTGTQQPQRSQQPFNSQLITGVQQRFEPSIWTHRPQQHLHSFAASLPPQQQSFAGAQQPQQQFTAVQQTQEQFMGAQLPPEQCFGTLQPHGQFNGAQQPQQLFIGNQQQFGTFQQPQQQFRTYTRSHQQQQPIQPAPLQPHQQHPVNKEGAFNPFTVS